MRTNPVVEQNKNIRWSESPWNQSGRKGKDLWRKGLRAMTKKGHQLLRKRRECTLPREENPGCSYKRTDSMHPVVAVASFSAKIRHKFMTMTRAVRIELFHCSNLTLSSISSSTRLTTGVVINYRVVQLQNISTAIWL